MRLAVLLGLALVACGPAPAPKLSALEKSTFTPSCAFATCHKTVAPVNGLDLEGTGLYARLVDVQSTVPGKKLVVAGDLKASYLIEKLTAAAPAVGTQMPPGAPLDAADLEQIKAWVSAGAKND